MATSPWLRRVAKEDSARELVLKLIETNPILRAHIISDLTGIEIDPEDIHVDTPQERFERAVINRALKAPSRDRELIGDDRWPEDTVHGTGARRPRRARWQSRTR